MKGSTRAATGIAVGYLLGRQRKFRTAAVMAAATAVGGTTVGGLVMRRGMKMLESTDALGKLSPQLTELVDTVRGDLLTAGKAAVAAAASNRVDALTDSLHERAEQLRNPVGAVADGAEDVARETGRAASAGGRRAASAGGRAASAAGGATRRATGRGGRAEEPDDEYEDYEPEEPESDEAEDVADEPDEYPDDEDVTDERDEHPDEAEDVADERETAPRSRRTGNGRAGNARAASGRKTAPRSPVTRTGR